MPKKQSLWERAVTDDYQTMTKGGGKSKSKGAGPSTSRPIFRALLDTILAPTILASPGILTTDPTHFTRCCNPDGSAATPLGPFKSAAKPAIHEQQTHNAAVFGTGEVPRAAVNAHPASTARGAQPLRNCLRQRAAASTAGSACNPTDASKGTCQAQASAGHTPFRSGAQPAISRQPVRNAVAFVSGEVTPATTSASPNDAASAGLTPARSLSHSSIFSSPSPNCASVLGATSLSSSNVTFQDALTPADPPHTLQFTNTSLQKGTVPRRGSLAHMRGSAALSGACIRTEARPAYLASSSPSSLAGTRSVGGGLPAASGHRFSAGVSPEHGAATNDVVPAVFPVLHSSTLGGCASQGGDGGIQVGTGMHCIPSDPAGIMSAMGSHESGGTAALAPPLLTEGMGNTVTGSSKGSGAANAICDGAEAGAAADVTGLTVTGSDAAACFLEATGGAAPLAASASTLSAAAHSAGDKGAEVAPNAGQPAANAVAMGVYVRSSAELAGAVEVAEFVATVVADESGTGGGLLPFGRAALVGPSVSTERAESSTEETEQAASNEKRLVAAMGTSSAQNAESDEKGLAPAVALSKAQSAEWIERSRMAEILVSTLSSAHKSELAGVPGGLESADALSAGSGRAVDSSVNGSSQSGKVPRGSAPAGADEYLDDKLEHRGVAVVKHTLNAAPLNYAKCLERDIGQEESAGVECPNNTGPSGLSFELSTATEGEVAYVHHHAAQAGAGSMTPEPHSVSRVKALTANASPLASPVLRPPSDGSMAAVEGETEETPVATTFAGNLFRGHSEHGRLDAQESAVECQPFGAGYAGKDAWEMGAAGGEGSAATRAQLQALITTVSARVHEVAASQGRQLRCVAELRRKPRYTPCVGLGAAGAHQLLLVASACCDLHV
jgi:hypothetical protein